MNVTLPKYAKDDISLTSVAREREEFMVDKVQMYALHDFSVGEYFDCYIRHQREYEFAMISLERHFVYPRPFSIR